jgi:hypothetical protein
LTEGICNSSLLCTAPPVTEPGIILNSATGVNCETACNACYATSCLSVGTSPTADNGFGYMSYSPSCSLNSVSCNYIMNIDPSGLMCSTHLRSWTYCRCSPF